MIAWLKDLFAPVWHSDRVFGRVQYLRQVGWWEGRTRFGPSREEVELLIPAARTGPSHVQHEFFHELQERFPMLLPDLVRSLRSAGDEMSVPQDLEFILAHVTLPEQPDAAAEWEMGFRTKPSTGLFDIYMRGWEMVGSQYSP